jgi:hypothetical protein
MTQEKELLTEPEEIKLRSLGSSTKGFTVPASQLTVFGLKREPYLFSVYVEKDKDGNIYIVFKKVRSNP